MLVEGTCKKYQNLKYVNVEKEKVAFSVREYKKKQQRDEISRYMTSSSNDDDEAFTFGDFIKTKNNE